MRGHIRQQGKGSWELKFDIGPDPKTRKRRVRYVTVHGNKRKAEAELSKYLGQLSENTYLDPSKLTVGEYLEQWLADHAMHRVSAKTFERYAEIVRTHLIPALGHQLLLKLSPVHIQARQSAELTARRTRTKRDGTVKDLEPLSKITVKYHHRVLSQALKQAMRMRLIARNPAEDVDPPRPARREMNILNSAQIGSLARATHGKAIHLPILIAVTTGMRRGEILALRWKSLDLDSRTLSVSQTLEQTKAGLAFKSPKTERSRRTISLPLVTVEALRRHRARQAEKLLAIGIRQSGDTLVCCKRDGSPIAPRVLTHVFAKVFEKPSEGWTVGRRNAWDLVKDLPRIRFHDLRHTHISQLLAAGVHPKVASERAGHASISITLDVYSHLIPGMQEDAASRIDAELRTHLER